MTKILIVEDDTEIAFLLKQFLEKKNYIATTANTGLDAISLFEHAAAAADPFHAILLDLMLPDLPGEKILSHIRKTSDIPILILSAKSELESRLDTLKNGADDYIMKPFHFEEVFIRIETVLRRSAIGTVSDTVYSFKDILLNDTAKTVTVNHTLINLTPKEYDLLALLMAHPKQVHTKETIYDAIWHDVYIDDNAINVHMSNLRKKLVLYGTQPPYITTVWGIGYKLS